MRVFFTLFIRIVCLVILYIPCWMAGVIVQACVQAFDQGRSNCAELDKQQYTEVVPTDKDYFEWHSENFLRSRGQIK